VALFKPPDGSPGQQPEAAIPPNTLFALITFPCQDVASLGCKLGMAGERTVLVNTAFAAVEYAQRQGNFIPYLVFENVEGVVNRPTLKKVRHEAVILDVLNKCNELGYDVAYRTVDSNRFPVFPDGTSPPMGRRRFIMVASLRRPGVVHARHLVLAQDFVCVGTCQQPCGKCVRRGSNEEMLSRTKVGPLQQLGVGWDLSCHRSAPRVGAIPCLTTGNYRFAVLVLAGLGMLHISNVIRFFGLPAGWFDCIRRRKRSAESRQADASHHADVWGFLGDSVSSPVVTWVVHRIINAARYAGDYSAGGTLIPGGVPAWKDAWPRALYTEGSNRYAAPVGPAPFYVALALLGSVVERVDPLNATSLLRSAGKLANKSVFIGPVLSRLVRQLAGVMCGSTCAAEVGGDGHAGGEAVSGASAALRRSSRGAAAATAAAAAAREPPVVHLALASGYFCGGCTNCTGTPSRTCVLRRALDLVEREGIHRLGAVLSLQRSNAIGTVIWVTFRGGGSGLARIVSYDKLSGEHVLQCALGDAARVVRLWECDVTDVEGLAEDCKESEDGESDACDEEEGEQEEEEDL